MYSKHYKLNMLKNYYLNNSIKQAKHKCPFKKNPHILDALTQPYDIRLESCENLCGCWPELGDIRKGCPCLLMGTINALKQVEYVLIKEGYLDSLGKDFNDG